MNIEAQKDGGTVRVRVLASRLDGDNEILGALRDQGMISEDVGLVDIDFETVEFINSLGITELVNIHRVYTEKNPAGVRFVFRNVDKKVNAILELVEIQKIAEIRVKS